jgi:hypothetical protein
MTAPPFFNGAVHCTVALVLPGKADNAVGAPGVVTGTNMFEGFEGGLVPTAFVAVTRHVYVLPFVKAETTMGLAVPVADALAPPLCDVQATVKLETRAPPSLSRRNVTDADPGPRVAVPIVGAIGAEAANAIFGVASSNAPARTATEMSAVPNALARCVILPPESGAAYGRSPVLALGPNIHIQA